MQLSEQRKPCTFSADHKAKTFWMFSVPFYKQRRLVKAARAYLFRSVESVDGSSLQNIGIVDFRDVGGKVQVSPFVLRDWA